MWVLPFGEPLARWARVSQDPTCDKTWVWWFREFALGKLSEPPQKGESGRGHPITTLWAVSKWRVGGVWKKKDPFQLEVSKLCFLSNLKFRSLLTNSISYKKKTKKNNGSDHSARHAHLLRQEGQNAIAVADMLTGLRNVIYWLLTTVIYSDKRGL